MKESFSQPFPHLPPGKAMFPVGREVPSFSATLCWLLIQISSSAPLLQKCFPVSAPDGQPALTPLLLSWAGIRGSLGVVPLFSHVLWLHASRFVTKPPLANSPLPRSASLLDREGPDSFLPWPQNNTTPPTDYPAVQPLPLPSRKKARPPGSPAESYVGSRASISDPD